MTVVATIALAEAPARALAGMPIPLHPGAERYFREKGVLK